MDLIVVESLVDWLAVLLVEILLVATMVELWGFWKVAMLVGLLACW